MNYNPLIEHLYLIKELLIIISIFYLRKTYVSKANIFGILGLGLYGVFIIFNYEFFGYISLGGFGDLDTFRFDPNRLPGLVILDRVIFLYFLILYLSLFFIRRKSSVTDESVVRKTLLDLSTKHTRLELRELSERTNVDRDTLKEITSKMIKNNEIYGRYFSTSKSIVFNQEANIKEIDHLLALYEDWEKIQFEKSNS